MINDALLDKLAHLSMLEFEEDEKAEMKIELEKMITFIEKLNELDTTGVEPLLHMSEQQDVFRKDEVEGQISREDAFKNAPEHDGEFFKVPKVIRQVWSLEFIVQSSEFRVQRSEFRVQSSEFRV